MYKLDIDLESTIHRYLNQMLSEEQMVAFEDYYVDKPEVIEKIEITRAMMRGLQSMDHDTIDFQSDSVSEQVSVLTRIYDWFSSPIPAYNLVVCFLLAWVITQWTLPQYGKNANRTESLELELLSFSSATQRNANHSIEIELSKSNPNQAIFIKVAQVDYRKYRLHLIDTTGQEILWQSEPFVFSALNDKLIVLPSTLQPQNATVELYGIQSDGQSKSIGFCHYSEACRP